MTPTERLFRWQIITFATLWVGYAGYYVCRVNLSVSGPLIQAELAEEPTTATEEWLRDTRDAWGRRFFGSPDTVKAAPPNTVAGELGPRQKPDEGAGKRRFGLIASLGLLAYTLGKFFGGIACDFIGGRRVLLFGMFASVACTIAFGLSAGFAAMLLIWAANRLVQSMGWGGVVKVASRWFPAARHGSVLGLLTLSYLFGDTLARLGLGALMKTGLGWRGVFLSAAATLATIALVSCFTLKSSPGDVDAPEPEANPENVYGQEGNVPRPAGLFDLLWPLASSFSFWLVCVMSFGLTLVRETFNLWNPIYLKEVAGLAPDNAALASALFPFVGGLSTIAAGLLTDRLSSARRGAVMLPFLILLVAALFSLSRVTPGSGSLWPLLLTSVVSFALLGPYSFLTGVLSLDFGGKRGSSTAAGLADTAGYLGGILSGYGIGSIAESSGWSAAFMALGVAAVVTVAAAVLYWYMHDVVRMRKPRRAGV